MGYKKGRPLVDGSVFFRVASDITFYSLMGIAYGLYLAFYHSRIRGRTRLAKLKKAVLVSNHTTFLDPVLMSAAVFSRRTYHTLLDATVSAPFLGTFTRLLGGVPVPSGRDGLEALLAGCRTAFKYRRFIHFYPEGECYLYSGQVRRFRHGAFYIAAKLNAPVVPMATIFHHGSPGTSRPRVELAVLNPLYPKDYIEYNESGEITPDSLGAFSARARDLIQEEIIRRGGTDDYFKGHMGRLKGIN